MRSSTLYILENGTRVYIAAPTQGAMAEASELAGHIAKSDKVVALWNDPTVDRILDQAAGSWIHKEEMNPRRFFWSDTDQTDEPMRRLIESFIPENLEPGRTGVQMVGMVAVSFHQHEALNQVALSVGGKW